MKPYRVYRNLHKGNFSIQTYLADKKGYRVTDRVSVAILEDCSFRVYETGRPKVITEKRKNVHAYVESKSYKVINDDVDVSKFREIYYSPYDFDSFVYKDSHSRVDKIKSILTYNNKLYDVSNKLI